MYVTLVVIGIFAVWGMLRTPVKDHNPAFTVGETQGVTSTGTCVVRTKPDIAEVDLGVSQSARTARGAKDYVKSTCQKIIEVLIAGGVSKKDIQTQDFYLTSQWGYGPGGKSKKWSANETLHVRIKDLDKVTELVDSAVKAGANRVGSLEYSVENVGKIRAQGRAKAAKVAHRKAGELAKALGGKLSHLVACSEGYPDDYGYRYSNYNAQISSSMHKRIADSSASEEITMQPGEIVTKVVVTATYAVE